MTTNDYLQSLLVSQELSVRQENDLQAHKKEVTDFLRAEFGAEPKIKYAGSREKGTMISENYDLDIVCYFPSSDTRPLKEIRDDMFAHLSKRYLLESKASAERILDLKGATAPASYHIDVVPGRFIEGTNDVFLHIASGERERMQTNLKTHIDYITNSGCVDVIRLMKLWACRNQVSVKTFILELFVVQTLAGYENKSNLRMSLLKVFNAMEDNFDTVQLIDPANTNNIVSHLMSASEKSLVAEKASNALAEVEGSTDITPWQVIFGQGGNVGVVMANTNRVPTQIINPSGPWAV